MCVANTAKRRRRQMRKDKRYKARSEIKAAALAVKKGKKG